MLLAPYEAVKHKVRVSVVSRDRARRADAYGGGALISANLRVGVQVECTFPQRRLWIASGLSDDLADLPI